MRLFVIEGGLSLLRTRDGDYRDLLKSLAYETDFVDTWFASPNCYKLRVMDVSALETESVKICCGKPSI